MKTLKAGLYVVVAICLFVQKTDALPVSALLEQGIYTEETVGDLDRAIEIYSMIVENDQANRKDVAEALFRMARGHVATGNTEDALKELHELKEQFPEQKGQLKLAAILAAELTPEPLFPVLDGCRLKYLLSFHLKESDYEIPSEYSFYKSDMVDLVWSVNQEIEQNIDRIRVTLSANGKIFSSVDLLGATRSFSLWDFLSMEHGRYSLSIIGYNSTNEVAKNEARLEIKPVPYTQIMVNEILPNTEIRFVSIEQQINRDQPIDSRSFNSSDFVHVEKLFDGDGKDVEFTEKHEGSMYHYEVMLNKPIANGEILFLGTRGWMENVVNKTSWIDNEYRYQMTHSPGINVPTRRVEIYRLPAFAELLSTMSVPQRVLKNGQVEILVDTIIPAGGKLKADFTFRLVDRAARITLEDAVIAGLDIALSPEEYLQASVKQFFQSNWRDIKDREDIEWGPVQTHENGNRSIRYKYKARIWNGEMQVFEDTFTFDEKGVYVGVDRTKGYPMPLDKEQDG